MPWLGPSRKNQLGFNMRLKAEVDLKLKIVSNWHTYSDYVVLGLTMHPPCKILNYTSRSVHGQHLLHT